MDKVMAPAANEGEESPESADIHISVLRLNGKEVPLHGLSADSTLQMLRALVEEATGVPPRNQILSLGTRVVAGPQDTGLVVLGVIDGAQLTLVMEALPHSGVWVGKFEYLSFEQDFEGRIDLASWSWLDSDHKMAEIFVDFHVLRHPRESTVGCTGTEVMHGEYDWEEKRFVGHGVSLRQKTGSPDEWPFLGQTPSVTIDFTDDMLRWTQPDPKPWGASDSDKVVELLRTP